MTTNYLEELDLTAEVNLNKQDFKEYLKYKYSLFIEELSVETIEDILSGFIWERTEAYED